MFFLFIQMRKDDFKKVLSPKWEAINEKKYYRFNFVVSVVFIHVSIS